MNTHSSLILRGAMAATLLTSQAYAADSYFEWIGANGGGDGSNWFDGANWYDHDFNVGGNVPANDAVWINNGDSVLASAAAIGGNSFQPTRIHVGSADPANPGGNPTGTSTLSLLNLNASPQLGVQVGYNTQVTQAVAGSMTMAFGNLSVGEDGKVRVGVASGDLGGTTTTGDLSVSGLISAPAGTSSNPVAFQVGTYTSTTGQTGSVDGEVTAADGLVGFATIEVGIHHNSGGTGSATGSLATSTAGIQPKRTGPGVSVTTLKVGVANGPDANANGTATLRGDLVDLVMLQAGAATGTSTTQATGSVTLQGSYAQFATVDLATRSAGTESASASLDLVRSLLDTQHLNAAEGSTITLHAAGLTRITSATTFDPNRYAAIDADDAMVSGKVVFDFDFVPAPGTHTFDLIVTGSSTALDDSLGVDLEVVDLPVGFVVDSFRVVEDGGVDKLRLVIAPESTVSPAPVLHWPLEEESGTLTTESITGTTDVATLIEGPTRVPGIAPYSTRAVAFLNTNPGSYIDAGTLQTDGQYVSAASAVDNQVLTSEWTVAGWVELPEGGLLGGDQCILTSDTDGPEWWLFFIRFGGGVDYNLGFDFASNRRYSGIDIPTGKPVFVSISGNVVADSFGPGMRHRFAVWDGSAWKYQTGDSFSSIRLDGLEIGSFADGVRQLRGSLDALRIYDKALGEDELAALALNNTIGGDLGGTVSRQTPLTNSTNAVFTVQFTEDVQNFDASDLIVTTGPSLLHGTPSITGSGSTYTVTIGVQGDGPISLDLVPGTGVQSLSGDPLVNGVASESTVVDQTRPQATVITPLGPNPTPALTVQFDFTFSEPVTGFNDASDLHILHTGTAHTGVSISGSGANYTVTLTGVTGDGGLSLTVDTSGGAIDLAGNPLLTSVTSDLVVHFIDTTPPTVVSITPDSTGPTQLGPVGYTVVFSEAVLGFKSNSNPNTLVKTPTDLEYVSYKAATSLDGITHSFNVDEVVVLDGAASGSLVLAVSLASGITDLAGNPLIGPSPPSTPVVFLTSDYQQWAISKGLTAGVNFDYSEDADNDGRINGEEFVRDGNPLVAGDPIKQRGHLVEITGQRYGVLTVAAPDDFIYEAGSSGQVSAYFCDDWPKLCVEDFIESSTDLLGWPSASAPLIEDPSVVTPPGMPALSPGWSYRHFRLTSPTSTLPTAFLRARTVDDD